MNLFGDITGPKRRETRLKVFMLVFVTGWRAPSDFPNLAGARAVAIDTETKDLELTTAGPGWARGKGHIVGISLAAVDHVGNRGKWYFPIRHEVGGEANLPEANVLAYVKHVMADPLTKKVGANLLYDFGYLSDEGIYPAGEIHDVQFAEALIDNTARVALDVLAHKYLGEGKDTPALEQWIVENYKPKKSAWRGDIWRAPPALVGPYAEADADLPLRLWEHQMAAIERENLGYIYRLECDLIPLYILMRRQGVAVNVEYAHRLKLELEEETKALYEKIYDEYGFALESTDSRQLAKLFNHIGVDYPYTKAGNPSITKDWLDVLDHPVGDVLNDIREHEKMIGTFIQSYIIDKHVNGKLYPQFHPLAGEENGTKLGRFASSDPNLQNIPSRTKLGKRVREAFVPDPGHAKWRKHDYSQIHYRILADIAVDGGDGSAERLREEYRTNPNTDFHRKVYNDVAPLMGWSMTDEEEIERNRRPIKNVNFSGLYGVGIDTLHKRYLRHMSMAQVKDFLKRYHEGAPYIKKTMEAVQKEAEQFGFVTSLLGRRARFTMWEPWENHQDKKPALPKAQAIRAYGSFIRMAFLYRAINYKIQGSEPDIMKQGMYNAWKSGVFDYTGVPRLTVHDELDFSVAEDTPEMNAAFDFIKREMENAITLRVPIICDATEGENWGKCA